MADENAPIDAHPIDAKELPVKRYIPEGLQLEFSDQMMIRQRGDGLFILYFLQTKLPLAITADEVASIEHIEAKCVAQILVTASQLKKNLDAMSSNFQRFIDKLENIDKLEKLEEETRNTEIQEPVTS